MMFPCATPNTSNTFSVSRCRPVASKHRRLLADRTDLHMAAQRKACATDTAKSHVKAAMNDFSSTIFSRHHHHQFLACILREVQHYHLQHHGVMIPHRAMEILAEPIAMQMNQLEVDNYATCLAYLGGYRLYSPGFCQAALKMVAADSRRRRSGTSSDAMGLSHASTPSGIADDGDVEQC